jgi:hypothetical protein
MRKAEIWFKKIWSGKARWHRGKAKVAGRNLKNIGNLESLHDSFDINNAWESITENMKTSTKDNLGYQNLKHNKQWIDDECSMEVG